MNQPLAPSQKKTESEHAAAAFPADPSDPVDAETIAAFSALLKSRQKESLWLVPLIVLMVIGATIYLAIINNKVEYVYSLATACVGYYFGQRVQIPIEPMKKPAESLTIGQFSEDR